MLVNNVALGHDLPQLADMAPRIHQDFEDLYHPAGGVKREPPWAKSMKNADQTVPNQPAAIDEGNSTVLPITLFSAQNFAGMVGEYISHGCFSRLRGLEAARSGAAPSSAAGAVEVRHGTWARTSRARRRGACKDQRSHGTPKASSRGEDARIAGGEPCFRDTVGNHVGCHACGVGAGKDIHQRIADAGNRF